MKQKIHLTIITILLVLLVAVSGICIWLFMENRSQERHLKALNSRCIDAEDEADDLQQKVNELEEQIEKQQEEDNSEAEKKEEKQDKSTVSSSSSDEAAEKKTDSDKEEKYTDISDLETAAAKGLVDPKSIDTDNLSQYFMSYSISDTVFDRIYGDDRSFKTYCTVSRDSLAYIKVLHYDYNGDIRVGELIASKDISDDLLYIFQKLFENKYEIEKMVLVEEYGADDDTSVNDNNTSCFNFRYATDSTELSDHATGHAIDVNPLQNPYFRVYDDGTYDYDNKDAQLYWDRTNDPEERHMINHDDLCYQLFTERGFSWGGDWANPIDYQHFYK